MLIYFNYLAEEVSRRLMDYSSNIENYLWFAVVQLFFFIHKIHTGSTLRFGECRGFLDRVK